MSYDEIIQRCSSDFYFFMALMSWFAFFLAMAWRAGKEFVDAVSWLIDKLCDRFKRTS